MISLNDRKGPVFGPGGTSEDMKAAKLKTPGIPAWLKQKGLTAFEYECGRGVPKTPAAFSALGEAAKENGITLSVHAPYFISLSGLDDEIRLRSVDYIRQSVECAELMGAGIIVVHCGSCAQQSREDAMARSADTLGVALDRIKSDVVIGVETMGKINQLGTLEEVVKLCGLSERLRPVVDFGHLNARNLGGYYVTKDDYGRTFDYIGRELGADAAKYLHCHFSKIMFTPAGGEKEHLTFEDTVYGPEFEPLMEAISDGGFCPSVICESAGTQAADALMMAEYFKGLRT